MWALTLLTDAFDMYAAFGEAVALLFTNNSVGETAGSVPLGGDLYLVQWNAHADTHAVSRTSPHHRR